MPALLQLDRLSHALPDGRVLFSDLQFTFAPQRIGLVGDNGGNVVSRRNSLSKPVVER